MAGEVDEQKPLEERIGWLEVFRAGKYPQGTYTVEDVKEIAESYDPEKLHEAPATLDHEQDGPAYAWVSEVKASGKKLLVKFKDMTWELAFLLENKMFKKRSVEIYNDFEGTGKRYLKAVTFLGAAAPQVKGMPDPAFKEEFGDSVSVDFSDGPDVKDEEGRALDEELKKLQEEMKAMSEQLASEKAEKAAKDAELAELQEKVSSFEAGLARDEELTKLREKVQAMEAMGEVKELTLFCDKLVTDGKVTPAQKEGLVEFMARLDSKAEVSFGEEKKAPMLDWFKEWLGKLSGPVELGEKADFDEAHSTSGGSEDVDRIEKFAKEHGVSFKEAALELARKEGK